MDARNGFGPPVVCGRRVDAAAPGVEFCAPAVELSAPLENGMAVSCGISEPGVVPKPEPKDNVGTPLTDVAAVEPVAVDDAKDGVALLEDIVDAPVAVPPSRENGDVFDAPFIAPPPSPLPNAPVGWLPNDGVAVGCGLRAELAPPVPLVGGGSPSTRLEPKLDVGWNGLIPPKPVACGCSDDALPDPAPGDGAPNDRPASELVMLLVSGTTPRFVWKPIRLGLVGEPARRAKLLATPLIMPAPIPLPLVLVAAGGDTDRGNAPVASCCSVGGFGTGGIVSLTGGGPNGLREPVACVMTPVADTVAFAAFILVSGVDCGRCGTFAGDDVAHGTPPAGVDEAEPALAG